MPYLPAFDDAYNKALAGTAYWTCPRDPAGPRRKDKLNTRLVACGWLYPIHSFDLKFIFVEQLDLRKLQAVYPSRTGRAGAIPAFRFNA
jgi:hypothetical protein